MTMVKNKDGQEFLPEILLGLADAAVQIGKQGLQWAIPKIADWALSLSTLEDIANGSAEHIKEISFPGPHGKNLKIKLIVSCDTMPDELKHAIFATCERIRSTGVYDNSSTSFTHLLDAKQLHSDRENNGGGVSLLNGIFSVNW